MYWVLVSAAVFRAILVAETEAARAAYLLRVSFVCPPVPQQESFMLVAAEAENTEKPRPLDVPAAGQTAAPQVGTLAAGSGPAVPVSSMYVVGAPSETKVEFVLSRPTVTLQPSALLVNTDITVS